MKGNESSHTPLLLVEKISKTYWPTGVSRAGRSGTGVRALEEVSLSVSAGECVGIAGESGCGKTTLARCVLGLITPDDGSIRFAGQDLSSSGWGGGVAAGRIQAVFQDPFSSLNPRLRIEQIVAEPLLAAGLSDAHEGRRRVRRSLHRVGLPWERRHQRPRQFSGGECQRIAIARALVAKPRLLVADEVVSSLDPGVRRGILELLARLQRESGLALLLISHGLEVLHNLCHRVVVLLHGRVAETGPTARVFGAPAHPYTRALLAGRLEPGVTRLPGRVASADDFARPGRLERIGPGHLAAPGEGRPEQ